MFLVILHNGTYIMPFSISAVVSALVPKPKKLRKNGIFFISENFVENALDNREKIVYN